LTHSHVNWEFDDEARGENKALVREWTEQIWNRCRIHQIPNFYSPDFVADYSPTLRNVEDTTYFLCVKG
jgi:hypothetical protein